MHAQWFDIIDRTHEILKTQRIVVVIVVRYFRNLLQEFMDANDDENNNPTTERPCETRRNNNSETGWLVGLVGWLDWLGSCFVGRVVGWLVGGLTTSTKRTPKTARETTPTTSTNNNRAIPRTPTTHNQNKQLTTIDRQPTSN